MKYFLVAMLISLFCISFAYAQESTQIEFTRERDAQGKWTNWTPLTVVWDAAPTPAESVPDHMGIDDDAQQDWYTPFTSVETVTWYKFTFMVDQTGEYAVRLSMAGVLWTEPASCTVKSPAPPRHGD